MPTEVPTGAELVSAQAAPPGAIDAPANPGVSAAAELFAAAEPAAAAAPQVGADAPSPEFTAPETEPSRAAAQAEPVASAEAAAPEGGPPRPRRRRFVELPEDSTSDLQLEQPWEVSWQRDEAPGVDLPEEPDTGGIELASNWEFVKWTEPADDEDEGPAPSAAAPAPVEPGTAIPRSVQNIQALLAQAERHGAVAQALLGYCEGRFARAFLFVEQFDTAMVWRGIGEGSDDPALAALRVDLSAPSMLRHAVERHGAVHIEAPDGEQDEALFMALSPRSPYLVIAPVFAGDRVMNFVYAESELEPLSPEAEAELLEIAAQAGRAYERLARR